MTTTTGRISAEHETVDDLRRELVRESATWRAAADTNRACAYAKGAAPITHDAYTGSLMAASYSYALAAVLGVAAGEFGAAVAERLAFKAAGILIDGDGDDLNADVRTPEPASAE